MKLEVKSFRNGRTRIFFVKLPDSARSVRLENGFIKYSDALKVFGVILINTWNFATKTRGRSMKNASILGQVHYVNDWHLSAIGIKESVNDLCAKFEIFSENPMGEPPSLEDFPSSREFEIAVSEWCELEIKCGNWYVFYEILNRK